MVTAVTRQRLKTLLADRARELLALLLALVLSAGCLLLLFLKFPAAPSAKTVVCLWESGAREEPYAEVLRSIAGVGEEGVLLERDGERGAVQTGAEFARVRDILARGELLDLLLLDASALAPIERAALYLQYKRTVYFSGKAYAFDGNHVVASDMVAADCVILLDGALPAHYLKDIGATALDLRAAAEFSASDLTGSAVENIVTQAPYEREGDALFLSAFGERTLIATLPHAARVYVPDCTYVRGGALACAREMTALDVPFVGSAKTRVSGFEGSLAWMLCTEEETAVPAALTSLRVRGGIVDAFAFRNTHLEEVDLCSVDPADISRQAFLGMDSLRFVHTPLAEIELKNLGDYAVSRAPCGCTVYERI